MAFEQLDAGFVQQAQIDRIEAVYFAVLGLDQAWPAEHRFRDGPAIPGCVFEILCKMCRIGQQFLGHAAADYAGAAHPALFTDRHPRAVAAGANAVRTQSRLPSEERSNRIPDAGNCERDDHH